MRADARSKTTFAINARDREIIITRIFEAPRELVWKLWTDPKLIPQWWGPRRYTGKVEKMDFKPGGVWRFVQRDSSGNVYAFNGVFREIFAPERLVYTFEFEGMPGHISIQTVTFEALDGRTKLTNKVLYSMVEDLEAMVKSGMEEGVVESMDRFAKILTNGPD